MRTNSRVPMIALPYSDKAKAMKKEMLIDYSNGKIYVVSATDNTVIFDVTNLVANVIIDEHMITGDDLTINIDGIGEVNLTEYVNKIYKNQITMVDPEGVMYAGPTYQYDNKSILIKNYQIGIANFDSATELSIPQKFGEVIRWVPISSAGSTLDPGSAPVLTITPDVANGNISLQPEGKQKCTITVGKDETDPALGVYQVILPTPVLDYNIIELNLKIGNITEFEISFPNTIIWQFTADNVFEANSHNILIFTTFDKGSTWLATKQSFSRNVVAPSMFNAYNRPDDIY